MAEIRPEEQSDKIKKKKKKELLLGQFMELNIVERAVKTEKDSEQKIKGMG